MSAVQSDFKDSVLILTIGRGKVNALNEALIEELAGRLSDARADDGVRAVILTGRGKFFSFGFDIPEFLDYSRERFTGWLEKFSNLYREIFIFPKPVVAALNGHAIAGACMLAIACDRRVMVEGRAKISLNEIGFGSTLLAGSLEMLRFCVGDKNAQEIAYSGGMYDAKTALAMGLVDRATGESELMETALTSAGELAAKDPTAFESIKRLLRGPTAEAMASREPDSIAEFVRVWYSESIRSNLREIQIKA